MIKINKIVASICSLGLLTSLVGNNYAQASESYDYDFESGAGFIYTITDNEISIVQYACSPEGVNGDVIPDEIDGYPITTIGYRSFHLIEMLESITLPETLVTIEPEAFAGCEMLTSIVIPRSVKEIGNCALGYDFIAEEVEVGSKYSDFTIYGYNGTAAETYAIENGFDFIALDDISDTTSSEDNKITVPNGVTATMYGDVNLDKIVNVADVVMLNMFFSNSTENPIESDVSLANADCLKDNYINTSDATLIMNYVAMKISIDNLGK